LSRIDRDLRFNLVTRFKSKTEIRKQAYSTRENNENIISLTANKATDKNTRPKFVFTYLRMPHYPYYFDKDGKEYPFEMITEGNQGNQQQYVEYLQYSNKRLLWLVDQILNSSAKPPVIVLMGDHGFRHFTQPVELKYHFLNLMSIHLPDKKYSSLTDTFTSVNLFRTILNREFGQQLPLLKDSTSFLVE
jgi:phosphoglycerol transferase MdoB-like AlkP superfamily enzyme